MVIDALAVPVQTRRSIHQGAGQIRRGCRLTKGGTSLAAHVTMTAAPHIAGDHVIADVNPLHVWPHVGHDAGSIVPDDPLAKEKAVTLNALSERDMVLLDIPVTEQYFHNLFLSIGLRPVISYRAKSYEMVRSLVASGVGYSLLIMRPANTRAYGGGRLA